VPVDEPSRFAAIYAAHARGVHAVAYRVLGRSEDAEDVTQEVFTRLWREPERFDPARGELGAYLKMMARSRALDLWRHDQSGGRASERLRHAAHREDVDLDEQPAAAAERDEERELVRSALRQLPAAQREALVLAYWGGLSADEVARRTRVPFGTARSRVRLGLAKLRGACDGRLSEDAAA